MASLVQPGATSPQAGPLNRARAEACWASDRDLPRELTHAWDWQGAQEASKSCPLFQAGLAQASVSLPRVSMVGIP